MITPRLFGDSLAKDELAGIQRCRHRGQSVGVQHQLGAALFWEASDGAQLGQ